MQEIGVSEHLGIVTSDTSTLGFHFFLTPLSGNLSVGKDDYVVIEHPVFGESCPVVAVVREISNFEKAAVPGFGDKNVESVADCVVIGYVDDKVPGKRVLRSLLFPPNAGSKVFLPFCSFLEDVFCRDLEGNAFREGAYFGCLAGYAVDGGADIRKVRFFLDVDGFVGQNFFVSGVSGAGKSHFGLVAVEELANRADVGVVVLDSFGEYCGVGAAGGQGFPDGVSGEDYMFGFGVSVYASDLKRARGRLHGLGVDVDSRFAVGSVPEDLSKCVGKGGVSVFDAEGLSFDERHKFFEKIVSGLLERRVKGSVPPFVLVVEDADGLDAEVLRQLVVEGKKVGISVCLLTCNPSKMDDAVLARMDTHILGRTTGKEDLEYAKNIAQEYATEIPKLAKGQFIINGINQRKPTKIHIRQRYSKKV